MDEVYEEVTSMMKDAVTFLGNEFKQLRTGRASTSILDGVVVDYYGTETPLNQVANLTVADTTLLAFRLAEDKRCPRHRQADARPGGGRVRRRRNQRPAHRSRRAFRRARPVACESPGPLWIVLPSSARWLAQASSP